jgi:hypothetical protein
MPRSVSIFTLAISAHLLLVCRFGFGDHLLATVIDLPLMRRLVVRELVGDLVQRSHELDEMIMVGLQLGENSLHVRLKSLGRRPSKIAVKSSVVACYRLALLRDAASVASKLLGTRVNCAGVPLGACPEHRAECALDLAVIHHDGDPSRVRSEVVENFKCMGPI